MSFTTGGCRLPRYSWQSSVGQGRGSKCHMVSQWLADAVLSTDLCPSSPTLRTPLIAMSLGW